MENNKNNKSKRKRLIVFLPLVLVFLLILVGGVYWYRQYAKYIKTDDAYIDTDNISVSSKMFGRIVALYVDEGDTVQEGELLAVLDTSDLTAQKEHAIAVKKQAETNKLQADAQYEYNRESIRVLEVNYEKASSDLDRASEQYQGGVIPEEQYEHTKKAFETAEAQLQAARTQLKVSKAQIRTADASIKSAESEIHVIETQLEDMKLYAPINGIVARRWLLPGDVVQPGQSLLTVTNHRKLWVLVYLEETKIADVHLDQESIFSVDAFSNVVFTGRVYSIGTNTASQFSLIPPNNASGNFTKVTQRIPVKISIDGTRDQQSISDFDLLAGMSVIVRILKD